jgi:DNA polymerase
MLHGLPDVVRSRKISRILILDFETYWDSDYTLAKGKGQHTTTEYVRSKRFHAHGMSYQWYGKGPAKWVSHKALPKFFASVNWAKTAIVCHNTAFDGFILTQIYGVTPAYYFDTLSMARAYLRIMRNDLDSVAVYYGMGGKIKDTLDSTKGKRYLTKQEEAKLAVYANRDVELTAKIFDKLLDLYPDDELDLINLTIRAYCEPLFRVNKKLAIKIRNDDAIERQRLMELVGLDEKTLRSREKFAEVLRAHGVEPPMKVSPTTNQPTYAFAEKDLDFQDLFHHPSEKVRALCEARLMVSSTITKSKAERLLAHATPTLPIMLKYGSAHTLRWGGGDLLNPQNFPRDSDLRKCIIAPPGHKLVIVDSSQIEARMLFWLADQLDALDDFRSKKDLYLDFASEYVYMRKLNKKIDTIERFVGKVCVLGLGYMMGWVKLGYTLESGAMGMKVVLNDDLLKRAVQGYRTRFDKVKKLWEKCKQLLEALGGRGKSIEFKGLTFEKGRILLPNGMPLQYPNMRASLAPGFNDETDDADKVVKGWTYTVHDKKIYNGLLLENFDQSLARLCVAQQILTVTDRYRLGLMVHDEGVFVVPTRQAKRALDDILEAFHTPPEWCPDLPTAGEGVISDVYIKP